MLKIKAIQYLNIPIKTRYLFLKHLQRNVHEFALNRQESFIAAGTSAEHFHRDKQKKSRQDRDQLPVCIHAIQIDGYFALRAYTEPAIATLDHYQKLFKAEHPELAKNCIESSENCNIKKTDKTFIYESDNWLPYRDCTKKNGVFYDQEKNKIANFDNRVKGNIGSFLRAVLGDTNAHVDKAKSSVQLLQNNPKKTTK